MDRGPYSRNRGYAAFTKSKRRRWRKARSTLTDVNLCRACDGAVVKCPVCSHVHCDDACRPISCIEKEQRDDIEPASSHWKLP